MTVRAGAASHSLWEGRYGDRSRRGSGGGAAGRAVANLRRASRADVAWMSVVALVYVLATVAVTARSGPGMDRMMLLAIRISSGNLDVPTLAGQFDTVAVGRQTYLAFSLLPTIPYFPFVPFPQLWPHAKDIIPLVLGIIAAWLSLPLARRYGASGRAAYWVASLSAFGSLLLYSSVSGNFYYLAHVQAVLACFVALIEWQGRRRPWILGVAFGAAFLARPTVVLAALPFGAALALDGEQRVSRLVLFVVPIGLSICLAGLYDFARFGSPLESGYAASLLVPELEARREAGIFSLAHVPYNLYLFVAHGFEWSSRPPFIFPDLNGQSILLTSPAVMVAVNAARRDGPVVLLAAASALVAIPLFLFYGGGVEQYGYRYALDFTPFLLALVAIATRRRFANLERLLIALSVLSVAYGVLWAADWLR
jgi:hypothetical protein